MPDSNSYTSSLDLLTPDTTWLSDRPNRGAPSPMVCNTTLPASSPENNSDGGVPASSSSCCACGGPHTSDVTVFPRCLVFDENTGREEESSRAWTKTDAPHADATNVSSGLMATVVMLARSLDTGITDCSETSPDALASRSARSCTYTLPLAVLCRPKACTKPTHTYTHTCTCPGQRTQMQHTNRGTR